MMSMGSRIARQKAWFLLGMMLCVALTITIMPYHSVAQEEEPVAQDAPVAEAEVDAPKAEMVEGENFLIWIAKVSGVIGLVLLLLSVYFVSTVGRLFYEMRLDAAVPPETIQNCENLLEQRDFKGVYNFVKEDDSYFSRLLATGITELPNGLAEARDAMERVSEAIMAEMEKKISMLAVLGTVGPMIGLLGTLKGMIAAFSVIARSDVQIKASEVANAVSEALVTTFEGVALSVPAIYFFALFHDRVIHIATSATLTADQYLRHFSHAGRAKASAVKPTK